MTDTLLIGKDEEDRLVFCIDEIEARISRRDFVKKHQSRKNAFPVHASGMAWFATTPNTIVLESNTGERASVHHREVRTVGLIYHAFAF